MYTQLFFIPFRNLPILGRLHLKKGSSVYLDINEFPIKARINDCKFLSSKLRA